jgi:hypothetical protein
MVAGAINRIDRFPKPLTAPHRNRRLQEWRFRKSRAAGKACQSETKTKKARPQRPGFFVLRAPQLVG